MIYIILGVLTRYLGRNDCSNDNPNKYDIVTVAAAQGRSMWYCGV